MKKIDTHQHLLYPELFGYSWTDDFEALQGKFSLGAYREAAEGCAIEGSLFMEVDVDPGHQSAEAKFFSALSENPANGIVGVIAKALPESPDFAHEIESLRSPALKGIRRVLHTQPNELSESSLFRRNIASLAHASLTFDLCLTQQQLAVGKELVRACTEVRFILDHCGVPSIAMHSSSESESWQQWQSGIRALAEQPNIACKFSGITAYATPAQRNAESLRPYLNEILEAFGSERIVWGSDWPVCNLAEGLKRWSEISDQLLAELSAEEQNAICVENARRIYHL